MRVLGIGGAGIHMVVALRKQLPEKVETLCCDSDACTLELIEQPKLMIGREACRGLGTGGNAQKGEEAVLQSLGALDEFLSTDRLVLCLGLGGGMGTGAAPIIAQEARKRGVFVVVFASFPFPIEHARVAKAELGLMRLYPHADWLCVLRNQNKALPTEVRVHEAMIANNEEIAGRIRAFISLDKIK